jgi:ubiquinone/menaquinone biosynthesis C-methylase UbiE
LLGRFVLWNMNARHSRVTDWGLSHISIGKRDSVLDVGCGGGRTVSKLAAMASEGKVCGIDYSSESVAMARRVNRESIASGRVEIREASVSELPYPEEVFDVVTAIETHFWWPDIAAGMREIWRVTKPGGSLVLIAEVYKGATSTASKLAEKFAAEMGMAMLSVDEHRELFAKAGYSRIQVIDDPGRGWICGIGRK